MQTLWVADGAQKPSGEAHMKPILPTICENCGFGREHVCERSVCPCSCHEPAIAKVDPEVLAYARSAGQEILVELAY
jgi:hypothetical protein